MIADSAKKPTGHDGFRAESVITPLWRCTGATIHTLEVDSTVIRASGTAATSISSVWMKLGVPRNGRGGDVGQDWSRGRAVPGPGCTASAL
jgi:hypothetical protein